MTALHLVIAADMGIDPADQFQRRKGLDDVIIRPQIQAEDLILLHIFGRQHQDRHIGKFAHLLDQGETIQPRHHDIEDAQRRFLRKQIVQRRLTISFPHHLITLLLQKHLDQMGDLLIVLSDQYPHNFSPFV